MTTTSQPPGPSGAAMPRRIEYVPIDEVNTADRNPRSHLTLQKVKGSMRKYGFVESAVHDGRTDRIIAGHGRQQGLQEMQADGEAPPEGIVERDGVWLMPLTYGWSSRNDAEAETLLVNLNRLAETGGWEKQGLTELLEDLRETSPEDFDLTGFNGDELDAMLADMAQVEFENIDDPEDLDDVGAPPAEEDAITRRGDVWLLGRHRLVCGDSTDLAVVRKALDGGQAQLVFTDPPYGVKYEGQKGMTIINDDLSADDLGKLLLGAFGAMKEVLIPGGAFYVCGPSGRLETTFRVALEKVGLELRSQLVWMKDSLVLGRADYHGQHETMLYGWQLDGEPQIPPHFDPEHDTMLYGWKDGAAHTFEGGRKQTTVWLYPKPRRSDLHPTMKPVALVRRAVVNSSKPGVERGWVLDLFGGSGSTLIACELSARSAALVELDPPYADVICRRFQEHTGVVPILERTGEEVSFV